MSTISHPDFSSQRNKVSIDSSQLDLLLEDTAKRSESDETVRLVAMRVASMKRASFTLRLSLSFCSKQNMVVLYSIAILRARDRANRFVL